MKLTSTFSCGTIFSLLCKNKKRVAPFDATLFLLVRSGD